MTRSRTFLAAAALTLLFGVPTAQAQRRDGGGQRGGNVAPTRALAPRFVAPAVGFAAPVRFYRPYYVFRPRVSLGFGVSLGFPIAYPYYYGYYNPYYGYAPYGYPSPYMAYGDPYPATSSQPYPPPAYPPSAYPQSGYPVQPGSVAVQGPNQANAGGVSFEITPGTAEVLVDAQYLGTVDQFTPTSQPLGLTPGRHKIEIRAAGYRPIDLDVDIIAGQVLPYQGALER
jgi:hypothetical protein